VGDEAQTLTWGEDADAGSVSGALEYCNSLNHGGITPWRLATQKELQTAYAHGIHDLDDDHTATDNLGDLDTWFWSSSTQSDLTSYAWYVVLNFGATYNDVKTYSRSVLCVSP
jgi:hypothetical protein